MSDILNKRRKKRRKKKKTTKTTATATPNPEKITLSYKGFRVSVDPATAVKAGSFVGGLLKGLLSKDGEKNEKPEPQP